jgi:excisionase family DNA binding protein
MMKVTYTVAEAAALLGISGSGAYECVRRGEIGSITLGRRVLITRAHLEVLLGPLPASALAPDLTTAASTSQASTTTSSTSTA